MKTIEIFCDGSGTTWDKSAGYGWVICVDGAFKAEGYGHIPLGTNNDAEVAAAINGMMNAIALLARIKADAAFFQGAGSLFSHQDYTVKLCSDSQLTLGWASGKYRYKDESRISRINVLKNLFSRLNAEAVWIKGHSGHEWNERCDALASFGRTGEMPKPKRKKKIAI